MQQSFQGWNVKTVAGFSETARCSDQSLKKVLVTFCETAPKIQLEIDLDKVECDKSIDLKTKLSSVDGQY